MARRSGNCYFVWPDEPNHSWNLLRLVFGLVAAALMSPMSFPDKRVAITAAFLDRFAIGFLICVIDLPLPRWAAVLFVALLVSLPSAAVTSAYAPIPG